MPGLPELLAAAMLASLVIYALLGGADFGAGLWDLLARGPRASAQRKLIDDALAPVWEANHVWLILAIVILFTAFPPAFSAVSTALHVPLTLLLLGIVFRGSAYVFRKYGGGGRAAKKRWGIVFAIASASAPLFLGVVAGSVAGGTIRVERGMPVGSFLLDWLAPFPLAAGAFALALFALLAAVYLAVEAADRALRDDFRRRAMSAGAAAVVLGPVSLLSLGPEAAAFEARLLRSVWSAPLVALAGLAALGALAALARGRVVAARALAVVEVAAVVLGWGAALYPCLIAPDLTIRAAAAPAATLELLAPALAIGAAALFPSLYWLLRVFKSRAL